MIRREIDKCPASEIKKATAMRFSLKGDTGDLLMEDMFDEVWFQCPICGNVGLISLDILLKENPLGWYDYYHWLEKYEACPNCGIKTTRLYRMRYEVDYTDEQLERLILFLETLMEDEDSSS